MTRKTWLKRLQVALEAQVRPDRRSIALIRESDDLIKEFRKFGALASLPVVKWVRNLSVDVDSCVNSAFDNHSDSVQVVKIF